jgi:hypothetical protein
MPRRVPTLTTACPLSGDFYGQYASCYRLSARAQSATWQTGSSYHVFRETGLALVDSCGGQANLSFWQLNVPKLSATWLIVE